MMQERGGGGGPDWKNRIREPLFKDILFIPIILLIHAHSRWGGGTCVPWCDVHVKRQILGVS